MPPAPGRRRTHHPIPHVALIIETSLAYGRAVLRGIARWVRENQPWSVFMEQRSLYDPAPRWLDSWKGDGIISRASSRQMASRIAALGIPTVDLNEEVTGLGLPTVANDHLAIGAMAAEHLLDRGFRHFGFVGYAGIDWSGRRAAGFAQAVRARGWGCQEHLKPVGPGGRRGDWEREMAALARWVRELPRPVGVMACNDFRAVELLDACRRAGVAVPEDVAVVGVDNEDIACELAHPPLSSVVPDGERVGHEAAKLLAGMMRGETPATRELTVRPLGLAVRQSSDVAAIADPALAAALHHIRRHACEGATVEDVQAASGLSRSVLQRRFRAVLGRGVHGYLIAARLERVKRLLRETALTLPVIAQRTGFRHSEYLSTVFKRETGETVTRYRQRHRRSAPTFAGEFVAAREKV